MKGNDMILSGRTSFRQEVVQSVVEAMEILGKHRIGLLLADEGFFDGESRMYLIGNKNAV